MPASAAGEGRSGKGKVEVDMAQRGWTAPKRVRYPSIFDAVRTAGMNSAPLDPIAALLQALPWSALTCLVLSWTTSKRRVRPLGWRWGLLLLLVWFVTYVVFLTFQYLLGGSGRSEVISLLLGTPLGYGLADFCVRRYWEQTGGGD